MMKNVKMMAAALLLACVATVADAAGPMPTVVVGRSDVHYDKQSPIVSPAGIAFPRERVEKKWTEQYLVTSATYTSQGWVIVMSKGGVPWDDQVNFTSDQWPLRRLEELKTKGYFVTSIAGDGKTWFLSTSHGTGIKEQWASTAPLQEMIPLIDERLDKGMYITSVACLRGFWTVVMSRGATEYDQVYYSLPMDVDLESEMAQDLANGYFVTSISANEKTKEWFCVLSRVKGVTEPSRCRFTVTDGNVVDAMKAMRQDGLTIVAIGG